MIKLLQVDNRSIKEIPANVWLEGKFEALEIAEGKIQPYLQLVIGWNGLKQFVPAHRNYVNDILSKAGLERIKFGYSMDYVEAEQISKKIKNHKFGFKLRKETYMGRLYNKLDDVISYAELGYQQALNR